ncbi:MAG: glutamate-ammonia ligase adenylyltransferase family protein [Betaproteobacteria bacterium]|nr:glutamate-ammonia ligase adenylyltransferase family protein [Betaproteobacteria bacterium]
METLLTLAADFSAYARMALNAMPALAERLDTSAPFPRARMHEALANLPPDALDAALRRLRREVMLTVMARDLGGAADLAEVTGAMTALAEEAISASLGAAVAETQARFGTPQGAESGKPQTLHVVGMGKLGGGELNVSSDIDLIFTYPEEGETQGGIVSVTNQEYFQTVGKRIIALLSELTGDGYVFRVDMRLRPWGDGPLAMGFGALEDYFVAHGRDWERYAWIKGRAITGDDETGLNNVVRPFVFRRYLDFGAIESLKGLHAQIKREVARRDLSDHVKLGPGGIREIEFIAQALQMIRGGREPRLRIRPTIPVLNELVALNQMPREVADELAAAYDFLRRVEHRLQYADDQQTHTLPRGDEARLRLAQSMGRADYAEFMRKLDAHRDIVRLHFETVLGDPAPVTPGNADGGPVDWEQALVVHGFDNPQELTRLIESTLTGARARRLAPGARERFEALLGPMMAAARDTATPDLAFTRLLAFAENIASRSGYIALLSQAPAALARLAKLLGASGWAAQYLGSHPILLDELIDERTLYAAQDLLTYSVSLRQHLAAHEGDIEAQMNAAREAHHTAVFRILAQDLQGLLTIEKLADLLSELADRTLECVLGACWATVSKRHRDTPRFAIIAYGKLGGKELGYASDLDLVFLYDDEDERASENYARLAQKLVTFLDTRTTAGRLFETDTRLRPDGDSGLLVSSLSAFRNYEEKRAWLWEHQALTRARFCAGDTDIGTAFERERKHILTLPRDAEKLKQEVRDMRKKMHDGHPNRSKLFDLKHDEGGMVDIEFCVQALVLGHAREHAALIGNLGNIALLGIAAQAGLLDAQLAQGAADAYRSYRAHQHTLRLNGAEYARIDPALCVAEIETVKRLWRTVLGD